MKVPMWQRWTKWLREVALADDPQKTHQVIVISQDPPAIANQALAIVECNLREDFKFVYGHDLIRPIGNDVGAAYSKARRTASMYGSILL